MRRLARTILLSVLIGAMLNIGVSWFLATTPSVDRFAAPSEYVHFQYPDRSLLDGMRYDKRGTMYVAISYLDQRYTAMGWKDDVPGFVQHQPRFVQRSLINWYGDLARPSPRSHYIAVIARGWPMLSLYSIEEHDQRGRLPGARADFHRGAIAIPVAKNRNPGYAPFGTVVLPYIPIWPGFIVNALIYGSPALPLLNIGMFRQWLRYRRGCCPNCGYDLRGKLDDGCSECGWRRASGAMPST